jgi:uncharacterized protein (DUF2062 family)
VWVSLPAGQSDCSIILVMRLVYSNGRCLVHFAQDSAVRCFLVVNLLVGQIAVFLFNPTTICALFGCQVLA